MLGVGGAEPPCSAAPSAPWPPSGGQGPQGLFFVFLQMIHVETAGRFEPVLVHFDGQRSHQAQAAFGIGEDAPLSAAYESSLIARFNSL
jgi:hypothetical protein